MSEPLGGGTSEEELRHQMLSALADAVENEDYDFTTEISSSQELLRPFEVAEYMDVKRRHSDDPVQSRRWGDALVAYLDTLEGQEFPEEEAEVINGIISNLEFEAITSNSETLDHDNDTDITEEEDPDSDKDDKWEDDRFTIYIDEEEMEIIRSLPVFKQAETKAAGSGVYPPDLQGAKRYIEQHVSGELTEKMLTILDWYVFKHAERKAQGSGVYSPNLRDSSDTIKKYSSTEEVADRMRNAIDKYVFKEAERAANGTGVYPPDLVKARKIIDQFASNQGRRDAMLRRLGFI